MKRLTDSSDNSYLQGLKYRLEENGIPAFISNEETNRIIPIAIAKATLWVYLDEQYHEAMCLLNDPDYEVQNPVDMDEFNRLADSVNEDKTSLNSALGDIFIRAIALLIIISLAIILFDRYIA